jgi:hypothetical protein
MLNDIAKRQLADIEEMDDIKLKESIEFNIKQIHEIQF